MGRLDGLTAMVTGAASGFGRGIVEAFAREGAAVLVTDIDGAGAEAVAADNLSIAAGHFYGYRVVEALGFEDVEDGVVRVSMVHYNSANEIERLIAAFEKVL